MDTILVVRPRQVQFKWSFDKVTGTVSNTGNTWFKLLIKQDVIRPKRKAMPGIYVRETWFISLSYVSRGIIIWSITTNSLRLAIPVRLSPLRRTKTYPSVEGRIPPQSPKNRLNDVEAIVNITCNDGLSHMHTIVFRRHGKVSGSLLTSGLITN